MLHNLSFFLLKCRLFHTATLFGSYIIHILNTGVLKFKRKFRRQRVNSTVCVTMNSRKYLLLTYFKEQGYIEKATDSRGRISAPSLVKPDELLTVFFSEPASIPHRESVELSVHDWSS
jgi:hypothetical protein